MDHWRYPLRGWRNQFSMIIKLSNRWSAGHLYHQKKWTEQQNIESFGKCFSQFGHGHNYQLEIEFRTQDSSIEDSLTRVMDEIKEYLDHKHLNFAVAEFKEQIPTTENLALFCLNFVRTKISSLQLACQVLRVRLYENDDLWSEVYLPGV